MLLLATFHHAATRQLSEVGLVVALLGGLAVAVGAGRRLTTAIGGLLIAIGLLLALIALHFGVSPYRHGR